MKRSWEHVIERGRGEVLNVLQVLAINFSRAACDVGQTRSGGGVRESVLRMNRDSWASSFVELESPHDFTSPKNRVRDLYLVKSWFSRSPTQKYYLGDDAGASPVSRSSE